MTELYIDSNPIVLSTDVSFDFFQKNPAFTRQGEYTYDIDIDLKVPQNAKVYHHLYRLHVSAPQKDRRAILIVDCKVLVVGTEIVLSVESHSAKIQVVSGYSELNYLASDGRKIRDLDFGQIPEINAALARESLNHIYPETNYSFPPVYDQYLSVSQSTDRNYFNEMKRVAATPNALSYASNARFVAQPFLMYYVEKVINLLGYTLDSNDLRNDEIACRLICINGVTTKNFNEMIPNWEINKFLTEIEKFFNVVFILDKIEKTVRISSTNSYHNNSSETVVPGTDVLKEMEKTYNVEESVNTDYSNVEYEDADSDIYKYYHINKETLKACEKIEVGSYSDLMALDLASYYNKLVIFHVLDIDADFVVLRGNGFSTQYSYYVYPVNQFAPIENDLSGNTVKLSIAPAEVYMINNTSVLDWYEQHSVLFAPVPYARNKGTSLTLEDKLTDYIQNGISENELTGHLYIAIYAGIKNCCAPYAENDSARTAYFPVCVNYPYMYGSGRWSTNNYYTDFLFKFAEDMYTLSLKGKKGLESRYYKLDSKVDTSIEYTIRFVCKKAIDQLDIFIIDNKKFLCKQLKRVVRANGMDEVVEGVFYAM